ncbi:hypothetical protein [Sporosarcina sp. P17b]|uniref:hypothetical protein n=1 Tax=Sporosarcina sp. P17b TaxID=2048260 RepID=UPI000C16DF6C|nr:hypothetical protein [Sporosarcina sp. P17b]PIC75048.1 hypothetical protein CSV76_00100 [Sporosarcina sp. P17b]
MATATQTKPVRISFDDLKKREEFINWAESEKKDNSPEMSELRSQLDTIRRIRRMKDKFNEKH